MPAAHIADQIIFFLKAQASVINLLTARRRILRHVHTLRFSKAGQRSSSANRMAGIGVAMSNSGLSGFIMLEDIGDFG